MDSDLLEHPPRHDCHDPAAARLFPRQLALPRRQHEAAGGAGGQRRFGKPVERFEPAEKPIPQALEGGAAAGFLGRKVGGSVHLPFLRALRARGELLRRAGLCDF